MNDLKNKTKKTVPKKDRIDHIIDFIWEAGVSKTPPPELNMDLGSSIQRVQSQNLRPQEQGMFGQNFTYPGTDVARSDTLNIVKKLGPDIFGDKYKNRYLSTMARLAKSKKAGSNEWDQIKANKERFAELVKRLSRGEKFSDKLKNEFETLRQQYGKGSPEEKKSPEETTYELASIINTLSDAQSDSLSAPGAKMVYKKAISENRRKQEVINYAQNYGMETKQAEEEIKNHIIDSKPLIDYNAKALLEKGIPKQYVERWANTVIEILRTPRYGELTDPNKAIKEATERTLFMFTKGQTNATK